MRLRSPIKQRGPATIRWEHWKALNRQIVQRRAGFKCEGCGGNLKPLELAHLVGRNNKGIGEPWASSAALTAALCSGKWGELGCHEKIDRALDLNLQANLRWQAVVRLSEQFTGGGDLFLKFAGEIIDPLDAIRETVRTLEEEGWVWDEKGGWSKE